MAYEFDQAPGDMPGTLAAQKQQKPLGAVMAAEGLFAFRNQRGGSGTVQINSADSSRTS